VAPRVLSPGCATMAAWPGSFSARNGPTTTIEAPTGFGPRTPSVVRSTASLRNSLVHLSPSACHGRRGGVYTGRI
jgi:hypothetical protein